MIEVDVDNMNPAIKSLNELYGRIAAEVFNELCVEFEMNENAPRKVRDIDRPVTVQSLAATIIEEIGQGQSDGWWFSSLPRVEALLLKYGYLLEKPDLLEKQDV